MQVITAPTLALLISSAVYAAPPDTSCAPEAVASREVRASSGDPKALYWLGTQLDLGSCGTRDKSRSSELLQQAASKEFPPAIHVIGVMLRRDGSPREALPYFARSAERGYQAGFADMGFTYGLRGEPVYDPVLSFAWLSVAISREQTPRLREYLEASRKKLASGMSEAELNRAYSVTKEISERFSSVPIWKDEK